MLNVVCTAGLMKRFGKLGLTQNWLAASGIIRRGDGGVVSLYAHKLIPVDVKMPTTARNFR